MVRRRPSLCISPEFGPQEEEEGGSGARKVHEEGYEGEHCQRGKGRGGEKGVDTNKRESKRKRLAAAAAAKEEEEEAGLSDDDENFVGYFGKDAKLQEKEKIVSFAPTPRIGSTKRVRMPTLPKGGVASKRTRRMKQKQHDLELELELDFEHEVELAEVRKVKERYERGITSIIFLLN